MSNLHPCLRREELTAQSTHYGNVREEPLAGSDSRSLRWCGASTRRRSSPPRSGFTRRPCTGACAGRPGRSPIRAGRWRNSRDQISESSIVFCPSFQASWSSANLPSSGTAIRCLLLKRRIARSTRRHKACRSRLPQVRARQVEVSELMHRTIIRILGPLWTPCRDAKTHRANYLSPTAPEKNRSVDQGAPHAFFGNP